MNKQDSVGKRELCYLVWYPEDGNGDIKSMKCVYVDELEKEYRQLTRKRLVPSAVFTTKENGKAVVKLASLVYEWDDHNPLVGLIKDGRITQKQLDEVYK